MFEKNTAFFNTKSYDEVFAELKFDKYYDILIKKLKNKKVVLYGAGILFDYFRENYDLSKINICAIADKRFETEPIPEYRGYQALAPKKLLTTDFDAILVCTVFPVSIKRYLKFAIFKKKKLPPVYFLLNKPYYLYWEEIFNR